MVVQVQPDWWFDSAYLHHFHINSPPNKKETMANNRFEFSVATVHSADGSQTSVVVTTRIMRNGVFTNIEYTYNPADGWLKTDYNQSWQMRPGMTSGEILDYVMALHGVGPGAVTMAPYVPVAIEVPVKPPQYAA